MHAGYVEEYTLTIAAEPFQDRNKVGVFSHYFKTVSSIENTFFVYTSVTYHINRIIKKSRIIWENNNYETKIFIFYLFYLWKIRIGMGYLSKRKKKLKLIIKIIKIN